MTKTTIELTNEQIEDIVLQDMKWHYENTLKDVERLMEKLMDNNIEPYEKEHLEEYKKTLDATRYMIKFYSSPNDWDTYFDSPTRYEDDEGENYVVNTDHD